MASGRGNWGWQSSDERTTLAKSATGQAASMPTQDGERRAKIEANSKPSGYILVRRPPAACRPIFRILLRLRMVMVCLCPSNGGPRDKTNQRRPNPPRSLPERLRRIPSPVQTHRPNNGAQQTYESWGLRPRKERLSGFQDHQRIRRLGTADHQHQRHRLGSHEPFAASVFKVDMIAHWQRRLGGEIAAEESDSFRASAYREHALTCRHHDRPCADSYHHRSQRSTVGGKLCLPASRGS
jgi:hypothetical protein